MDDLDFNITIVGLGLIGGSLAMALKELNPKNLWGVDVDIKALEDAENMGIIDRGYTKANIPLKESDIVIIALYPKLTIEFVRENMDNFKCGAIITDVAGIKECVVREINSFIREDLDFVGGHPMAGKESKGLKYASKDIFKGASYIFTPIEKNRERSVEILERIARKIGCKSVIKVSPKHHDEIIAFTSHLPHIVAVSLINSDIFGMETSCFIGGSFKDATRVADINTSLWTELLMSNKENVISKLDMFEENIRAMKRAIMEENKSVIQSEFERAGSRRRELL